MLQRIIRYLRALVTGKLDEWEDPDVIISDAVREMQENHAKNRELAIQAVTQKNNLQAAVDKEERIVADLERKATLSLQSGNRELALQFLKEKGSHDKTLESMRLNLVSAVESADKVKVVIRQEEDRIRVRTAEALAMKANLKQAQIQIKINKALDSFSFTENEGQWNHAQERIQSLQSQAAARAELAGSTIESKVRDMELASLDSQAEKDLAELELKIAAPAGTTAAPVQAAPAPVVHTSDPDAERQLQELEQRIGRTS